MTRFDWVVIALVIGLMFGNTSCAHREAKTGCLASVPVSVLVSDSKMNLDDIKDWNCEK